MPASSSSIAAPTKCRSRSRRSKWRRRRRRSPSTAPPTQARRSATFSAPRSSARRRSRPRRRRRRSRAAGGGAAARHRNPRGRADQATGLARAASSICHNAAASYASLTVAADSGTLASDLSEEMSHVARCRYHRRSSPDAAQAHLLARTGRGHRHLRRRRSGRRAACARHQRADGRAGQLDRPRHHHGPHSRRSGAGRGAGAAREIARPRCDRAHQQPLGTTAGSEQLHDSLQRLKEKKPLVVVVDGLAASGGYITAIAADHIVALETSLVGSIGVLFQYPNVTDLLKTLGVKIEEIKSSPLKAAPNGFEPTSPEARAAIESIVSDSYAWFKNMVKTRRHLDEAALERVTDGRVFTGRQGLALKLIDEIGDERTAIAWLAKEKNIDPNTPVRDYRLRDRLGDLPFLHTAVVATLDAVGLGSLARRLEEWGAVQAMERLNLDGLLALWHPPIAN